MATKSKSTSVSYTQSVPTEQPPVESINSNIKTNTIMATTNKVTPDNVALSGVQLLRITPYVKGVLSTTDHYDMLNCVEDTTSFIKDENSSTDILNEQGGIIKRVTTQGLRNFNTETGDIQDSILEGLFGYLKTKEGRLIEPNSLAEIYCRIEVTFLGGTHKAIAPKVKLDPTVTIEAIRTGIARGILAGVCEDITETVTLPDDSTKEVKWSFAIEPIVTP